MKETSSHRSHYDIKRTSGWADLDDYKRPSSHVTDWILLILLVGVIVCLFFWRVI